MNEHETFVAIQKNHEGTIINFKTSTGRVLSYRKAMMEIENGNVSGAYVFTDEDGHSYISATPTEHATGSLENLPTFF
ncbi:DUF3892 domain-containing protein [Anoxybacteroides tepidamans]|uniref:DUF3892 domain-containing protein n=1 Tax=Anoxybacteroides tepidamans TaxID=265948 RepID=UPI000489362A|nr:DUF3892 domain-containing protein [Anoxybacillus tepidamans]